MYHELMIHLEKELSECLTMKPAESGLKADFLLPEKLSYFNGHFPQNPILPAVALIDISLWLLAKFQEGRLGQLHNLKVKSPMGPGEKFEVEIHSLPEDRWSFLWRRAQDVCAELEITWRRA